MKIIHSVEKNWFCSLFFNNEEFPVFMNPSLRELAMIRSEIYDIKGLINIDGNLIVWSGKKTHQEAMSMLIYFSDFNKLFKGDHINLKNRNYIIVNIIDYKAYLCEDIDTILKENKINLDILIENMLKRNKYIKMSDSYKWHK